MDTTHWGWALLGVIVLGNFWLTLRVISNCLLKVDRLENKLMAMTEAYPHAAMIAMQREGLAMQQQAMAHNHPQMDPDAPAQPEWMSSAAS